MKAISIRQPWAWLIVNGHKDVENRTWPTRYRGRVLIHASKGMTLAEYDSCMRSIISIGVRSHFPRFEDLPRGGIVGAATISDCIASMWRTSPWHIEGAFGFQLENAQPLPFIECKGALGFFNVEVPL